MVTEFIGKAWKAYTKNFWQVVGATVLLLVLVAGVVLVGVVPLLFSGLLTISEVLTAAQFQLSTGLVASIFIFFAAIIAAMILSVALGGGLVAVYADALRGKAKFQTMFSVARKKFFRILGANALAGLIIIGIYIMAFALSAAFSLISSALFLAFFILSFIAAALISILFSFVNQAVIIDNRKAVDSVKTSVRVIKSNYLQFLALIIVLSVITIIISFVPILGFVLNWLVVGPVSGIAYTAFYLAKRKRR